MGEYDEFGDYKILNKVWIDGMEVLHAFIQGKEEILGRIGEIPLPFEEGNEWKSFEGFIFKVENHKIIKVYDPFEAGEKKEDDIVW